MPERQVVVMRIPRPRVISISLSEAEWVAFMERHPEPVDWLRQQIQDELNREFGGGEQALDN
jgi:hypothetical protein